MRRDHFIKISYLLLLLGLILTAAVLSKLPDDRLHMVFCDVGQGDATLLSYKSSQILIDGGPDSEVLSCLSENMAFWDRNIEMVVLTHPQADHMAGLIEVFERYKVEKFVGNGLVNDVEEFWVFREAVESEGVLVHLPKRGDNLRIGPVNLEVLWPENRMGGEIVWGNVGEREKVVGYAVDSNDPNEESVVLKLSFGSFDGLLTGDIGLEEEQALVKAGVLKDVEVLKVAHHGSKYASSSEYLSEIDPELAVISVGENNWYGHPTSDTLMRLEEVGAEVVRTDEVGEVEIVSDGEKWWVE